MHSLIIKRFALAAAVGGFLGVALRVALRRRRLGQTEEAPTAELLHAGVG